MDVFRGYLPKNTDDVVLYSKFRISEETPV